MYHPFNILSKAVVILQATAEEPIFHTTQKALEFELQEQQTAKDEASWISEGILPEHQHILDDLQNIQDNITENEASLNYLMGITELEKFYSNISAVTANRAFDLSMKGMKAIYSIHDLRPEVDIAWDKVQHYAHISNMHLNHAAEYHKFYYHIKHLNKSITHTHEQILNLFKVDQWEFCEGVPDEARKLRTILKKALEEFDYYSNESERLSAQAHSIVPIYMRSQPLSKEVEGVMLCDYDVGDFTFRAGDRVIVTSNVHQPNIEQDRNGFDQFSSSSEVPAVNITSEEALSSADSTETVEIIDIPEYVEQRRSLFESSSLPSGLSGSGPVVSPFWQVRGIADSVERTVPSVCVWITAPDADAVETAARLKEELLAKWHSTVDQLLQVACNFFRRFLNHIIQKGGVTVTDGVMLTRLFNLLEEAYPAFSSIPYNAELTRLMDTVRNMWTPTTTEAEYDASFLLRRSDIAQYISIIELLKGFVSNQFRGRALRRIKDCKINTESQRLLCQDSTSNSGATLQQGQRAQELAIDYCYSVQKEYIGGS
ncbi:uncharacterized protein DEA37_0014010 [Paragonimus westermani]|uniref:Desmoplakin SH3 domain-containing protein n=1 Tax=Paragonimus westermani TaxID=34504 RepID=A0A5J4NNF2_9TREM|nr:uncharacterized protein DEA37_0014010 [Paragonimus westermani]